MENDSKDMTIEQLGEQLNNLKKDYDAIRALVPDLDSKVPQQGGWFRSIALFWFGFLRIFIKHSSYASGSCFVLNPLCQRRLKCFDWLCKTQI